MFLAIFAVALIAGAVAFPTTGTTSFPIQENGTSGGFMHPAVFGGSSTGFTATPNTGFNNFNTDFNFYHRGEFQFLDFQMNQTAPFTSSLTQNIEIWTNVTYGPHPMFPSGHTTEFWSSPVPKSTEGYGQTFAGTYNGGKNNFINIDRTWSTDMCGFNYTYGYMDVWVRPMSGFDAGVFQEGFYTCFFNFTFSDTFMFKANSTWSPIFSCYSGPVNNYSYRLWYQFRFYNIPSTECNFGHFVTL